MGVVLEVVAPVFALIALGFVMKRRGVIAQEGFRGLDKFTFAIAAPALLFAGGTSAQNAGGAGAAVAFLAGALAVYAAGMAFARGGLRLPLGESGLFALNCAFGNSVMMGVPLILAAYGQAGLSVLLAILALHSLVLLGLATVIAEVGLNAHAPVARMLRATVLGMARNPVLVAVALALVWSALSLPVPAVVRRTLEFVGAAGPPVALVCLGASLVGLDARAGWRETAATTAAKLALMPAITWAACIALGLGPLETAVAVTTAALPTGANAFILAQRYATGADRSGAAVVVSTALSVLTLSACIGFFRPG
jgi:hypothetical protein